MLASPTMRFDNAVLACLVAGGKTTQVEEYAGDVLQRRLVFGDQEELRLTERWERHASGLQVHRSETHGGDAPPSVITVHRDRGGSRTYHEIAGQLTKGKQPPLAAGSGDSLASLHASAVMRLSAATRSVIRMRDI